MLQQPQGWEVVAAPALLMLVITTDPQLQREPPTVCHKISADKVAQLSSEGDVRGDELNARGMLSNKPAQLCMWGITQQLFVRSATEASHHSIFTIILLIHCLESWKLGLCAPFLRQFHLFSTVRCYLAFRSPGQAGCRAASPQPALMQDHCDLNPAESGGTTRLWKLEFPHFLHAFPSSQPQHPRKLQRTNLPCKGQRTSQCCRHCAAPF